MRTRAHTVSVCIRVAGCVLLRADDMSRVMCSCLHWVDGGGTWYITFVCAVCLWGPDSVYASCVFLLLICNTLLGVSIAWGGPSLSRVSLYVLRVRCVCGTLCVTVCLPCVSLLSALCILDMAGKSLWGNVFTYVCVSVCSLCCCSDRRDDLYCVYSGGMNGIHVVVLHPVCC